MRRRLSILGMTLSFMVSACAAPMSTTEKGMPPGVGAATGVLPGQVMGRNASPMLRGAAAGVVMGGIPGNMIGSYMDKQEQDFQHQVAGRQGTTVQRRQHDLAVTMKADLLFDTGSTTIKPGGYEEIARIADILNRYPETRVTIEGHTDSKGMESYNMRLSEDRARAVAEGLIARGVEGGRLTTVGHGPSHPIVSNNTESGRQINRRVTLLVTPIEA